MAGILLQHGQKVGKQAVGDPVWIVGRALLRENAVNEAGPQQAADHFRPNGYGKQRIESLLFSGTDFQVVIPIGNGLL